MSNDFWFDDPKNRVREDLPEALPIIEGIDAICYASEKRHAEMHEGQWKYLTHPFDMLTSAEKSEYHRLQLMLRPKTPQEAHTDVLKKREARRRSLRTTLTTTDSSAKLPT